MGVQACATLWGYFVQQVAEEWSLMVIRVTRIGSDNASCHGVLHACRWPALILQERSRTRRGKNWPHSSTAYRLAKMFSLNRILDAALGSITETAMLLD